MQAVCYYLEARSPFHLGVRGVGIEQSSEYCPSDTLFAALCVVMRQVCGLATLEAFLATYTAAPALRLTSAFPYASLGTKSDDHAAEVPRLRLYPHPVGDPPATTVPVGERKMLKDIHWLGEERLGAWLDGGSTLDLEGLAHSRHIWLGPCEAADTGDQESTFWKVDDVPRVTVDRVTSASQVYQAGRVTFSSGGGLWFMARWSNDTWQKRGETCLRVLGDEGLGGERSSGHGQFHLHGPLVTPSLAEPQPGGRMLALSLYAPQEQELAQVLADSVRYRLIRRRGWISSPDSGQLTTTEQTVQGMALRRRAATFFKEGSVLRAPKRPLDALGQLVEVSPSKVTGLHSVYRYGLGWFVGYPGGQEGCYD